MLKAVYHTLFQNATLTFSVIMLLYEHQSKSETEGGIPMDLQVLHEDLLNRARKALPNIPDHPNHEFRVEAAILIAEAADIQEDWDVARHLTNELTDLDTKAEKLEDIAKITQDSTDRLAAMEAADECDWSLDDDFSPKNISFSRSTIGVLFASQLITKEEIERNQGESRAEISEAYVSQLVNLGELEKALEGAQSILRDEAIGDSYWARSMQAIAVGYARAGDFSQANTLVEQTFFVEYGYVGALVEIASLIKATIK